MARVLDGFKDFNARVRRPHGFRLSQPARKRGFLTPSGRAEFGLAPLPDDVDPGEGRLTLATIRSHDQFNTTIYSNDDRYRGLTGLRTVVLMNPGDMRDRGLDEFDLIDITSFSRDGTTRAVYGYRAVRYDIARGCAAGYMPELNVLCGIADHSTLRPGETSSCRTSLAVPSGTRPAGPRYRTARPLPRAASGRRARRGEPRSVRQKDLFSRTTSGTCTRT
jgi:anaerobic selenocysteine-containing dehydrogenase